MPGTRQPGGLREVIALTASVTLTNYDIGKIFTNRGAAGAVTVTLPTPSSDNAGGAMDFATVAGQNLTVQSTGNLILLNDAAGN